MPFQGEWYSEVIVEPKALPLGDGMDLVLLVGINLLLIIIDLYEKIFSIVVYCLLCFVY